jgi:hypothetical protein
VGYRPNTVDGQINAQGLEAVRQRLEAPNPGNWLYSIKVDTNKGCIMLKNCIHSRTKCYLQPSCVLYIAPPLRD